MSTPAEKPAREAAEMFRAMHDEWNKPSQAREPVTPAERRQADHEDRQSDREW